MEIHQKEAGLDYHRLKTMVKRSIEQNLRMKNLEARNGFFFLIVHLTRHSSCSVHALIDSHHTAWLKWWCTLRLIRRVIHVCGLTGVHSSFLTLFSSVCFFLFFLLLLLEPCFLPFLFHVTSSRQYPTGTPANKSPLSNFERSAVVKNQRGKQREQRIHGDCWQWETNGQCVKGDNCSFRHDINKRAKWTHPNPSPIFYAAQCEKMHREPRVLEAEAQVGKWIDCCPSITIKEFAQLRSVKDGILSECLFNKFENGCKFGDECSHAHRQVEEHPSKRSQKNGDKSAMAMLKIHDNWFAYFRIWSRRSLHRPRGRVQTNRGQSDVFNSPKPYCVMPTFETKKPWFEIICPSDPYQRNANAPKFEDQSQEETERQERCAREAVWRLA